MTIRFGEVVRRVMGLNATGLGSLATCHKELQAASTVVARTYQILHTRLRETIDYAAEYLAYPAAVTSPTLDGPKELLKRIENVDGKGYTALMRDAQIPRNLAFVEVRDLIYLGANIHAKNNGITAFMLASQHDCTFVAEALLNAGAELDGQDDFGWTALMAAAGHGHEDIVAFLLQAKANVNTVDIGGGTALWHAARYGRAGITRRLLAARADATITPSSGMTLVETARSSGSLDTAQVLKEAIEKKAPQ
jgi:ankyrin repeat protein